MLTSGLHILHGPRLYLCHAMCLKHALFEETKSGIIQLKAICVANVVLGVKILGCFSQFWLVLLSYDVNIKMGVFS